MITKVFQLGKTTMYHNQMSGYNYYGIYHGVDCKGSVIGLVEAKRLFNTITQQYQNEIVDWRTAELNLPGEKKEVNIPEFNWTNERVIEFSKWSTRGQYGIFEDCPTMEDKIQAYIKAKSNESKNDTE